MKVSPYMPKIKLNGSSISMNYIVDSLSVIVIFLFSTHDCIIKLFPVLPYTTMCLLCLMLLIISIFLSRSWLNQRAMLFLLVIYTVIILNLLLCGDAQSKFIKTLFVDLSSATKLWVYFIVFSLIKDEKKWSNRLVALAYFNMILLVITVMSGRYSSEGRTINYLGLGITGAMWIPVLIQNAFLKERTKKTIHIIAASSFTLFITIYGNRGSVIAILAFLIYGFIRYTNLKRKTSISISIGVIAAAIYNFQGLISTVMLQIVENLGITSRNLLLLFEGQIGYTTHRMNEIWIYVLKAIFENWWFGYGLCYDRVLSGDIAIYAHNLFLEVWLSFGVIFGTMLLAIHLIIGVVICFGKNDLEWTQLFAPFFITSTVLLMFNNSFCQLGFFWIPYGVLFAHMKRPGKKQFNSASKIKIKIFRKNIEERKNPISY